MNRRDLLTLTPAALVGCAAPVQAGVLDFEQTPVMQAYREWNALYCYLNSDDALTLTEAEFDAECDRRRAMELRLAAIPSVGVADFAAKVLALTNNGDHELDAETAAPEFWAEARALMEAAA